MIKAALSDSFKFLMPLLNMINIDTVLPFFKTTFAIKYYFLTYKLNTTYKLIL
jgi:hypothetical protein